MATPLLLTCPKGHLTPTEYTLEEGATIEADDGFSYTCVVCGRSYFEAGPVVIRCQNGQVLFE